jgi:hypothetical protein
MFRSIEELMDYTLEAQDGEIGRCRDFLFDDRFWTLRYMVADTGKWLPGRKVLISPLALGEPDWASRRFPVSMTKEEIKNGPALEEHAPVSRRYEMEYFRHYGWAHYWEGHDLWGANTMPIPPVIPPEAAPPFEEENRDPESTRLRSVKEVNGYHIRAMDGEIGHVEDFILEEGVWVIRYMIVDTRNWLPGKKVLVSPGWIESIEWMDRKVIVNLTTDAVKNGPDYDPSMPINREFETRLYDFYGRPKYW